MLKQLAMQVRFCLRGCLKIPFFLQIKFKNPLYMMKLS